MIRKAKIRDIKDIQGLINFFARQDIMLSRSLNELYEHIRDFWVFEDKGKILGCCALHVCWEDLAEIKSLAVAKAYHKKGIGKQLIANSIIEAKELGAKRLFVLTYKPEYFKQFGFRKVKHSSLPHKIWADCINCPKFPSCKEVAMLKKL
ncbi:MAG: N-acetyltransferase [Candidatus Omnitrophota bacterium]